MLMSIIQMSPLQNGAFVTGSPCTMGADRMRTRESLVIRLMMVCETKPGIVMNCKASRQLSLFTTSAPDEPVRYFDTNPRKVNINPCLRNLDQAQLEALSMEAVPSTWNTPGRFHHDLGQPKTNSCIAPGVKYPDTFHVQKSVKTSPPHWKVTTHYIPILCLDVIEWFAGSI